MVDIVIETGQTIAVALVQGNSLAVALEKGTPGRAARTDITIFANGVMSAGEVALVVNCVAAATFDAAYCIATVEVRPTTTRVVSITKNGNPWATVTVTTAAQGDGTGTGTFAFLSGDHSVAYGDKLRLVGPNPADGQMAGFSLTIGSAP